MAIGFAIARLGYQMPISSGLPSGSAATPCWNPAACAPVLASATASRSASSMASASSAANRLRVASRVARRVDCRFVIQVDSMDARRRLSGGAPSPAGSLRREADSGRRPNTGAGRVPAPTTSTRCRFGLRFARLTDQALRVPGDGVFCRHQHKAEAFAILKRSIPFFTSLIFSHIVTVGAAC